LRECHGFWQLPGLKSATYLFLDSLIVFPPHHQSIASSLKVNARGFLVVHQVLATPSRRCSLASLYRRLVERNSSSRCREGIARPSGTPPSYPKLIEFNSQTWTHRHRKRNAYPYMFCCFLARSLNPPLLSSSRLNGFGPRRIVYPLRSPFSPASVIDDQTPIKVPRAVGFMNFSAEKEANIACKPPRRLSRGLSSCGCGTASSLLNPLCLRGVAGSMLCA